MNANAEIMHNDVAPSIGDIGDISLLVTKYQALQSEHLINEDEAEIRRVDAEMKDVVDQMAAKATHFDALLTSDDERATFHRVQEDWARFVQASEQQLIPLSRSNKPAAVKLFHELNTSYEDLVEATTHLTAIQDKQEQDAAETIESANNTSRGLIVVIAFAALVLSATIGFLLSTAISRNVALLKQTNTTLVAAASEILAATTQQAASAAEQSAAVTQTTTTIDEVKVIATQTAERAARVAQDSQAALAVARQGAGAVEQTVDGMAQIRARVESIATTILALAEQSHSIGLIITTVSELADQSNLLALNAAIEAARAGEAGKSFAVVAQHVRVLAERSKTATVQVRDILSDIQKATQMAVLVTEEGTKGVEAGGKLAASAGTVLHQIAGEVESGAQASVQIAAAAAQQTAGMEQIGQAMVNIQQATAQALASTRQAERAAQDLHEMAQSLQQAIGAL
jgi:methyl-accepting chemotaxis protein